MAKTEEKNYCVLDHANKQRDRERRYSRRRVSDRLRSDVDGCAEPTDAKDKRNQED
ncbi:MAG: hypothetical protein K0U72_06390 [Gammaproteobacteria bacterium]|nr:hypothetical protein [Gammaproteobacteria bacterium]